MNESVKDVLFALFVAFVLFLFGMEYFDILTK